MALILATASATPLRAADIVWTNVVGGSWATAANWKPRQVPGAADQVWITNSGTYTVTLSGNPAAAVLAFGGDTGKQTLRLTSGSFALNGPGVGNSNAILSLSGGTFGGTGRLTLAGLLSWNGGTISNTVECAGGGIIGSGCTLAGGQLINAGTLTWNGGNFSLSSGAVISNLAGATFDLFSDYGIVNSGTGASGAMYNHGLLRKAGTNSYTYIGLPLHNFGTVLVENGMLEVKSLAANRGTNISTAPGTLRFYTSTMQTLDAESLITGNGTVSCLGFGADGTVVINGRCETTGPFEIVSGTTCFNAAASVGSLTLSGGFATLGGTGFVAVAGPMTCSGGTITGAVSCVGGTLGYGMLNHGTLVNKGTLTLTNSFSTANASVISNLPGGTINLTTNGNLTHNGTGAKPTLFNAGVLRKSAGTSISTVNAILSQSGSAQAQTGTLCFLGGGTNTGSMNVSAGATLNFSSDSGARIYLFDEGSSVTGAGTVACTNSLTSLLVNGDFSVTGTNLLGSGVMNFFHPASVGFLTVSNGTLGGTSLVTVANSLTWYGGTITGAVQTAGGLITSTNRKYLTGGQLLNSGLLTITSSNVLTGAGSVISNAVGATFDIATNTGIGTYFTNGVFFNNGLLRKSGGTGTAFVCDTLHNTGTVLAQRGTLTLVRTGTNTGVNSATAPGVLDFGGSGTHVLGPDSSLGGSGTVQCGMATVEVNGTCALTGTNLLNGGVMNFNVPSTVGSLVITGATSTVGGTALLTATGPLNWNSGTITGAVQCAGGTIEGGFFYLTGGKLANTGTLRFLGGTISTSAGSVISNLPGATLNVAWNYRAIPPPPAPNILRQGSPPTAFYNDGLIRSAGFGLSDTFRNTGTVLCTNGTMSLLNTNPAVQTDGFIQLLGGKLSAAGGLLLEGGALTGTNVFLGNLTSSATLRPGLSSGVLTIASNYTELPGAVLEIELGGATPGTGFDQLVVTGAVALAGTLNVSLINGFVPPPDASFRFLTAGARTGTFSATNLPASLADWTLDYAPDDVTLRPPAAPPSLGVAVGVSNAVVVSWPWADVAWRLQTSTNLTATPPVWEELPPPYATNAAGSYFVEPTPLGTRYFRLVR